MASLPPLNGGDDQNVISYMTSLKAPPLGPRDARNAQVYSTYTSYQHYNGVTGEGLIIAQFQTGYVGSAEARVPPFSAASMTGDAYERQDAGVNTARQELQRESETGENMVPEL
ncbi:uncharacterized protein N0V89_008224 [Didymosphaeria variabile]|uniref:Uncharacterized protein n=1 Tax=Didymosphaeria variabile TaxID=1932322 RepID=A0A9W8XFU5_9PLEO|nr:uncharacterized protein N0V89_008224 [Didymosphaeria variabile]KAJ4349608.1 hypothetical protein N0V89_008224 [Didymosphaeria variabile]